MVSLLSEMDVGQWTVRTRHLTRQGVSYWTGMGVGNWIRIGALYWTGLGVGYRTG